MGKKQGRFKKFFADFKDFIAKGNVLNLAVAVIIGAAFNKIVTSLVNDLIMPIITLAVGGASIDDWKWVITEGNETLGIAENALRYGNFIQTIIDFLTIALVIFLIVRTTSRMQAKMTELSSEIKEYSKKENKAFRKELKAKGYTSKEIAAEIALRDEAIATEKKAAEEAAAAEAEANKPETTEQILADIRRLLAKGETPDTSESTESTT